MNSLKNSFIALFAVTIYLACNGLARCQYTRGNYKLCISRLSFWFVKIIVSYIYLCTQHSVSLRAFFKFYTVSPSPFTSCKIFNMLYFKNGYTSRHRQNIRNYRVIVRCSLNTSSYHCFFNQTRSVLAEFSQIEHKAIFFVVVNLIYLTNIFICTYFQSIKNYFQV